MCIAILNKGGQISRESLLNCWESNDDGAGILYVNNDKLGVYKQPNKGRKSFEQFYSTYQRLYNSSAGMPMLLHFRIATHGFGDKFLHPFLVSDTLGLVHNGIISGLGDHNYSDTAEFRDIIAGVPDEWKQDVSLFSIPLVDQVTADLLGTYNKVIFLDAQGDYVIYNESSGIWDEDNWYSNSAYRSRVRYYGHYAQPLSTAATKYYGWDEDEMIDGVDDKRTQEYYDEITDDLTEELFECAECFETCQVDEDAQCVSCGSYNPAAVDYVLRKNYADLL